MSISQHIFLPLSTLRRVGLALFFALLLLPCLSASAQSPKGLIRGKVVTTDGTPLSEIEVSTLYQYQDIMGPDYKVEATQYTDASGAFTMTVENEDPHWLQFSYDHWSFLEYYEDKPTISSADPITLTSGEVLSITVFFEGLVSIQGTVRDEQGLPIANSMVDVHRFDYESASEASALTDENGFFYISSLPEGQYKLAFGGNSIIYEYYKDVSEFDDAQIIDLSNGTSSATIDAVVTRRGIITGTVTNEQGEPLKGINISLYRYRVNEWKQEQSVVTDENGHYQISVDPKYGYRVKFEGGEPSAQSYAPEYYNDVPTIEEAQTITVPAEATLPNINAQLHRYSVITGTVTNIRSEPISNVLVAAYATQMQIELLNTDYYTRADNAGNYRLLVPPRLESKILFSHGFYKGEFYNDQTSADKASVVVVPVNSVLPNVNAVLDRYAVVTGTVTTIDGTPLYDTFIEPYWEPDGTGNWEPFGYTSGGPYTDAAGNYTLRLTGAGEFRIRFYHYDYGNIYYDVQANIDAATTLSISYNSITPHINAVMLLPEEVQAHFTATPRNGANPLTTKFTNQSLGNVISRSWDFGDGITSTEISPTHTYDEPGSYTVTLTVDGSVNSHTVTKRVTVGMFDNYLLIPFVSVAK